MKKIILIASALALPALASAQVTLISGFNFGQFIGGGYPALDGTTGDPVGSIGPNYGAGSSVPALTTSGEFAVNNSLTGDFSANSDRLYWDGTNGSSAYDNAGGVEIVVDQGLGTNPFNQFTVDGVDMALVGEGSFPQQLRSAVSGNKLAFVIDTTGFSDYAPAGTIDRNLTFSGFATGAPATINWFLDGSSVSFASTTISTAYTAVDSVYGVDLPTAFYGASGSTLVAEILGTVTFDNVQFNGLVAAIPEPSTYAAAFAGIAVLGLMGVRRRRLMA